MVSYVNISGLKMTIFPIIYNTFVGDRFPPGCPFRKKLDLKISIKLRTMSLGKSLKNNKII